MKYLQNIYRSIAESNAKAAVLISVVCLVTFGNTILNNYNLDDNLVTQNHRLTSKGIKAIPEIYRSPYYQDDMGYSYGYRPTTLASFAIEHELFGESATVSHTINLVLYLITCLLIYFLIKRVFPEKAAIALGTALLFTVHPIHTEVVASIKNRDELLSLFFMLLGIMSFIMTRYKAKWHKSLLFTVLGICVVGLSLSSKLSAAALILLIPFLISSTLNPIIRIIVYGLINLILSEIFLMRSGFYPWYFLAPFLSMVLVDLWKSLPWRKLAWKIGNILSSLLRHFGKLLRGLSNWILSSLIKLKDYLNFVFHNSVSSIKNFFSYNHLKKSSLRLYNSLDVLTDPVKIPLILALVLLFSEKHFGSVALLGLVFLALNHISIQSRVQIIRFILLALLASSSIEIAVPIMFPVLFFSEHFSKNKHPNPIVRDIIYLITGLFLVYVDIFVLKQVDATSIDTVFFFYCFSLTTSWSLIRLAKFSVIRVMIVQGIVVIISFILLLCFFDFDDLGDVFFTQLPGFLILFQMFIRRISMSSVNTVNRKIEFPFKLAWFAAVWLLLLSSTINLLQQAVQVKKDFQPAIENLVRNKSESIEIKTGELLDWVRLQNQDFSYLLEVEREKLSASANQFKTNTLQPLSKSTTPFEFDSTYVFQALQIKEQQQSDFGRPFDFVENPIPVSSNQFLRYGFYLSTLTRYLVNFFVPYDLAFYYGFNEVWMSNFLEPLTIIVMIALVLAGIWGLFLIQRHDFMIGFSLILMVSCLLPFSGVLEPLPGTYSPRFSYVSSLFFCSFTAGVTSKIFFQREQNSLFFSGLLIAIGTLVLFSGISISRNALWKNKLTLMSHDIKNVPNSAQAHNLLAHAIMEDVFKDNSVSQSEVGNVQLAETHFARATEIYPLFFNAWVDLGRVYDILGNTPKSINAREHAFAIDSTYPPIVLKIAQGHETLGDYEQAITYYRNYIQLVPTSAEAHDNLARILFQRERYQESLEVCEAYLIIDPANESFRNNLMVIQNLLNQKEPAEN